LVQVVAEAKAIAPMLAAPVEILVFSLEHRLLLQLLQMVEQVVVRELFTLGEEQGGLLLAEI
jgi:hypothetical protein